MTDDDRGTVDAADVLAVLGAALIVAAVGMLAGVPWAVLAAGVALLAAGVALGRGGL